VSDLLAEQRRYYAARAPEYDDWWFRRGRYALDAPAHARWLADVAEVEGGLHAFAQGGAVLELAAGTGLWTRHLVRAADRLVAVDASSEVLEINRARVDGPVEYVVADLFEWQPADRFDLCFFGFWHSHVPEERFDAFWALVRRALRPGGRIFLVDNARGGDSTHTPRVAPDREVRRLSDGREFEIVKRYWSPAALTERVAQLGFALDLRVTENGCFLFGGGG